MSRGMKGSTMGEPIQELAKLLSFSEKALNDRRRMIRMANPNDVEGQLLAWLRAAWEDMRDDDVFLRSGALPSDLGSRATNPRAPALGRGRTGTQRPAGKARRRRLRKVVKPPTAAQIEQAAEQSAYVEFRDTLDAGSVPRGYQTVLSMEGRKRFAEHQAAERNEARAKQEFKAVTSVIKQTAVELAQLGRDPMPFMTDIQRVVQEHREALDRAA
jgi:hypothetical protein